MPKYTLFYICKGERKEYSGESNVKLDAVTLLSKVFPGTFTVPDKIHGDPAPSVSDTQKYHGYEALRVVWHDS